MSGWPQRRRTNNIYNKERLHVIPDWFEDTYITIWGILSPTPTTNGSGRMMNASMGKCLRLAYLNDKSFGPVRALAFRYGPCFRLVMLCKLVHIWSGFSECLHCILWSTTSIYNCYKAFPVIAFLASSLLIYCSLFSDKMQSMLQPKLTLENSQN